MKSYKENIKINYPYIAVSSVKRQRMPIGITIYKMTKKGIQLDKTKNPRAYFGVSNTMTKAISNIRKWYNVNIPQNGWSDNIQMSFKSNLTQIEALLKIKSQIQ